MIARNMISDCVEKAWTFLPAILTVISKTVEVGKKEKMGNVVNIIIEEPKGSISSEEMYEKLRKLIEESGGKEAFREELVKEAEDQDQSNLHPKYIWWAVFKSSSGRRLTDAEMMYLKDVLMGELEPEDDEIKYFVSAFTNEYFGGQILIEEGECQVYGDNITFNFDTGGDIVYLEEDLILIKEYLNKILGKNFFDSYETDGTNVSSTLY